MATDAAGVNHKAHKDIAVLATELAALTREVRGYRDEVREYRDEGRERDRDHSQRLDALELAFAEQQHAEKERARIEEMAKQALGDVNALKKEQRWWTGGTTLAALIAAALGVRQPP